MPLGRLPHSYLPFDQQRKSTPIFFATSWLFFGDRDSQKKSIFLAISKLIDSGFAQGLIDDFFGGVLDKSELWLIG